MRKLGPWEVFELGLGAMPLSIEERPEREKAIEVIHHALDSGINHIDTAFAYYLAGGTAENGEEQHNEKLIAEALRTYTGDKSSVTVASKVGHFRYFDHTGKAMWGQQGCSRYILDTAQKSRDALGVDAIDLYYYHRPDLNVAYEESIGALNKLLEDGVIKFAGVSNASVKQIEYAKSVLGEKLIAVQNQFSPAYTSTLDTLEYCREVGLTFLPWSPLGGFRNPDLLVKDGVFEEVAKRYGVSKQQVILAWELSKGEHVIPIPGFRRFETMDDSIKAVELNLTEDDLKILG
ncbi:MAG: aldo/keto reductase [Candidatus Ancillula sp.]|jgi:aryl-alcohol dehydrogenase-like predicted oxidoreductase|nr:aldo/keto reductase [Candidatus Ancillula sp.]